MIGKMPFYISMQHIFDHVLKVYVNGGPSKRCNENTLTMVTYDGSTKQNKKAKVVTHRHHADAGRSSKSPKVPSDTSKGGQATIFSAFLRSTDTS